MTKAYQSKQGPDIARQKYGSAIQINQKTIAKGIKKGKAVQQAEGMSFANKQDGKKPFGKPLITSVRLEAIILNRFALICRDSRLGRSIINSGSIQDAINLVTGRYNDQISVFPAVSQFINNMSERRDIRDQLGDGILPPPSESQQAYEEGAEYAGDYGSDNEPGSELGFSQDSNSGSQQSSPSKSPPEPSPARSARQLEARVMRKAYEQQTQRATAQLGTHRSPGFTTATVIGNISQGPRIITRYKRFFEDIEPNDSTAKMFAKQIVDSGLTRANVNEQQDRLHANLQLEKNKYRAASKEIKKLNTMKPGTTSPNRRQHLESLQSIAEKRVRGYTTVNLIIEKYIRPELLKRGRGRRLSQSFDKRFADAQSTGASSSSSAAGISPRKPKGKRKAGEALSGQQLFSAAMDSSQGGVKITTH